MIDPRHARHLGLPAGEVLDAHGEERAAAALAWYREHGEPWSAVSLRAIQAVEGDTVDLEAGVCLTSERLAGGLRAVEAAAVAVVATSAGARLDAEVQRLWREEQPDGAVFLSALGAAEAERLRDEAVGRLAGEQASRGLAALPRYAPGYDGWDLRDLPSLLAALDDRGPLAALESGGLTPLKSTVSLIGLTARPDLIGPGEGFWERQGAAPVAGGSSLYVSPERALVKWSRERLALTPAPDGRLRAAFRFDGKTCVSLGRPFTFEYTVDLEREGGDGWRLAGFSCAPRSGDRGHRSSCAAIEDYPAFLAGLRESPPLLGQPLAAVTSWRPAESATACLCTPSHRSHKWRVVLETIHYALHGASERSP